MTTADEPAGTGTPRWALFVGAAVLGLAALGVCAFVILNSWTNGWAAGQEDADHELERAQIAEQQWHQAHPDPTEPVLPDYAEYFSQVADEVAAP
ncbi:hypothetical protein Cch01nite_24690 [Cellulomonas chitinilytica]|uniref:Uncharacterized protein n=1 Tax=Cellulomonas chitinilytica TaxID=398759 RepID=A0A919P2Y9_9CELL|nr:hypothetical protein [Cellulomonas chitinilytica]GIG21745.1 hypothetical protein Cch01nite_24690 [Cellulomonas chitinilytica]